MVARSMPLATPGRRAMATRLAARSADTVVQIRALDDAGDLVLPVDPLAVVVADGGRIGLVGSRTSRSAAPHQRQRPSPPPR